MLHKLRVSNKWNNCLWVWFLKLLIPSFANGPRCFLSGIRAGCHPRGQRTVKPEAGWSTSVLLFKHRRWGFGFKVKFNLMLLPGLGKKRIVFSEPRILKGWQHKGESKIHPRESKRGQFTGQMAAKCQEDGGLKRPQVMNDFSFKNLFVCNYKYMRI